ncbi:hypothetical protein EYF80_053659 [Liparis tanakae]|uniref:Uncharacterized protein n=1 Tax=Liparis tanakae TaxID=230148 RepID=A0A4Z2F748_9TELE|nr:hypothetical protein EYF80_053659 [Liparis tanakae]
MSQHTAGLESAEHTAGLESAEHRGPVTAHGWSGVSRAHGWSRVSRVHSWSGVSQHTAGLESAEHTAGLESAEHTAGLESAEHTAGLESAELTAGLTVDLPDVHHLVHGRGQMQVCCSVYWFLVTFHILTVPSLPLVASRPLLLLQPQLDEGALPQVPRHVGEGLGPAVVVVAVVRGQRADQLLRRPLAVLGGEARGQAAGRQSVGQLQGPYSGGVMGGVGIQVGN